MTAYGRAARNEKAGHFVIEIQSVNRKFLDVSVCLPRELSQFDIELKKWLLPLVGRGQITVKVNVTFEGSPPFTVKPNLPLARQLKLAWNQIEKELEMGDIPFDLNRLTGVEDLFTFEENASFEGEYRDALKKTFDDALAVFLQMKQQEGAVLQADICRRIASIEQSFAKIESSGGDATNKYRQKLLMRLQEVVPGHFENEERVLREIALFAEKVDIAEEITRFYCHLTHFRELLESKALSVGKTIEFVLQELNREINTIGSKSSDIEIARAVIDIKSELEKIREQIQNVE